MIHIKRHKNVTFYALNQTQTSFIPTVMSALVIFIIYGINN